MPLPCLVKIYDFAVWHHFRTPVPLGTTPHPFQFGVVQLGFIQLVQVWSYDLTRPIREPHSPNPYDWFRVGHMTQGRPKKLHP
jgi:hypothetical protein